MCSAILVLDEREDLFELVDDEHAARGRRPAATRLSARKSPSSPSSSCSIRLGGRRRPAGASAASSSSSGYAPGNISTIGQRSDPGSAPAASAGTRPARTTEDLPLPLGPTTARKRVARRAARRGAPSIASRPKKSAASASSNARRPLYGFRVSRPSARPGARPGRARAGRRDSAPGPRARAGPGSRRSDRSRPFSRTEPRSTYLMPSTLRARCATSRLASTSPGPARLHSRAARLSAPPR